MNLLLHNCIFHGTVFISLSLSDVNITYFPLNTTSNIVATDGGIIAPMKKRF